MSDAFAVARLLHHRAEIEALVSEREGMLALNQDRLNRGSAIAYDEAAFQRNADQLRSVLPDVHQFA